MMYRSDRHSKLRTLILLGLGGLVLMLSAILPAMAFDSFEHRYLGNTTFDIVSRENADMDVPWSVISLSRIANPDQNYLDHRMAANFLKRTNVPVGFGDLPALAGDFTDSVKDLRKKFEGFLMLRSDEVKLILAIRRQWFNACRWHREQFSRISQYSTLDQCFPEITTREQLEQFIVASDQQNATPVSTGYIPTRIEQSEFERLPGFVGLAATNKTHFPQHSWEMYIHHHYCALLFAAASVRRSVPIDKKCNQTEIAETMEDLHQSKALWYQAVIYEGFAHHFLHDSFSSGHIGVPYGRCTIEALKLLCRPTKQLLQHTHDTLNRIGIKVIIARPPKFLDSYRQMLKEGWNAFGDDQLLTPEASFHRGILLRVAVESLREIYAVKSETKRALSFAETCERWSRVFPIPYEKKDDPDSEYNCAKGAGPHDLWDWGWSGRSADERVADPVLEGWKILVTYGTAFGNFNQLNENGTVREQNRNFDMFTAEMGYVRSTGSWYVPNYLGFGTSILPEIRTSLYPLSWGYWIIPQSRLWFLGIRNNLGVRLEEELTEENPDDRLRAQVEATVVIDAGVEIYSPIALYIRIEPFSLIVRGLGSGAQGNQATVESFFNGRGAITAGLRFDLANVY